MIDVQKHLRSLDKRRRDLGISLSSLARLSGVSMPTVQRILSGNHRGASFVNVMAIADALEMDLPPTPRATARKTMRTKAEAKARLLVSMVQGTSALEAQAVDQETQQEMVEQTVHELLAGSRRALWSD
jgi:transcriptional regulator with XRE-family HTH domain